MHTKKQRKLASIIFIAFIAVALFSMLFIVKEAKHCCTGKNCPVCAGIHQAKQTLKQLGTGDTKRALGAPDFFSLILTFSPAALFIPCVSLISQKIRLNN